jgi:hypothetical protein
MMVIQQYNVMSKTKKVTVSMTEETKQKALNLSVLILGTENISGYISYLINKAHLEAQK